MTASTEYLGENQSETAQGYRIWLQSATKLGASPVWEPYEKALKEYANKVCRPDSVVVPHGVSDRHEKQRMFHYFSYLNQGLIIENAIRAEKEGYDGFCLHCAEDPARKELKNVIDMPIVQLAETMMYVACQLGNKFSFLAYENVLLLRCSELVWEYGLRDRFVKPVMFNIVHEDLPQKYLSDPEPLLKIMAPAARKMVEEGAEVLVPTCGCLSLACALNDIREIEGMPIIDATAVAIKMTEMMIDLQKLGLRRSNVNLSLHPSHEELADARRIYLERG